MLASSSSGSSSCLQNLGAFRTVTSPKHNRSLFQSSSQCRCHCSLTCFRELSTTQPPTFQNDGVQLPITETNKLLNNINNDDDNMKNKEGKKSGIPREEEEEEEGDDDNEEDEERKGISKIRVPRQKYISVSKADLLSGILSNIFRASAVDDQDDDEEDFLLLSSCLDSILHAEHKSILEEMRSDYFQQAVNDEGSVFDSAEDLDSSGINGVERSVDEEERETEFENPISFNYVLDLRNLLPSSSPKNVKKVAVATRFQRAFMQLLYDAQFEELSARDLMLTSALNTDYLLTLPVYVDWKRASESNAIIFRRGYAAERQKGLLIVEKLDYLQSRLLRGIFFIISKPLGKFGSWITEAFRDAFQTEESGDWAKRLKLWLQELVLFQQSFQQNEGTCNDMLGVDQLSDKDLPIWIAAQRAVSRYEGLLSPVGPRGRLLRKLLTWIGLVSPTPEAPFEPDGDTHASEPYKGRIFLSRITLGDIWRPATRKYCGNDIWKKLKTSVSILLSQSILQEPAFEELILLCTEEVDKVGTGNKADIPSLQLKIYEKIPIPDLPVVFPHKKLSFRIIDTVRLDVATMVGLLAYFINYKFEDVLSSPSAIFLDVVAITALIIYVSRVVLGYKQTWDRYQLLVNRTLYEKTLASGFGAVHFILDASEQQQYKEAILAYAILLKMEDKIPCRRSVGDKCERFMYDVFKVKVEVAVDKAINVLLRLGLATETPTADGRTRVQATPCSEAYEALKRRWNSLLGC
ncbi:uncharacterized protein LOC21387328 [Morus notabilis]|uniref:uncharacterized protein LOC21387328 n=1 Tax=Morus notabilis TaxID=981085 RepID=UPI000CED38FE|nr:uncharacterized protein LOC21387328 [Morus notabilis]